MTSLNLSQCQLSVINAPSAGTIFLEGPAGTGKTTAGVARTLHLLSSGFRADSILVLAPQRTLVTPYSSALHQPDLVAGGQVTVLTVGGLARRMLDLFWPLVAEQAGFRQPDCPPTFLTLETAQYYMMQVAQPFVEQGFFETVTILRNRLYSQILDNLNKAAVVGFPHTEFGERLKSAWIGDPSQKRIFEEAQTCANAFRATCLRRNLLDFSLQIEVFTKCLWALPLFQEYLVDLFHHLIVDNIEEDTPITHDLLTDWLPHTESALLIYDVGGGYRRFLGADPQHALTLKRMCDVQIAFDESFNKNPDIQAFGAHLSSKFDQPSQELVGDVRNVLRFKYHRYHPQMLDWVTDQIAILVDERGVPPGEIVILAPFMTDALSFSLQDRLIRKSIISHTHRPSRALREEPVTQCLLTLAALSNPQWGIRPASMDIANALTIAIDELDFIRSHLLAEILYRVRDGIPTLEPFDQIKPEMQERITYLIGERYEGLRAWIEDQRVGPETELDHFLGRLFGEVLSQAGYGFQDDLNAGVVTANLIESVYKFRNVLKDELLSRDLSLGGEYIRMVQDGLVASQYIRSWDLVHRNSVLLTPAYTFLMANRSVDFQFWLDVGAGGWWERLYQPLTHPYVLSRHWSTGKVWTDSDEFTTRQQALHLLTQGLIRRCRQGIFLGLSELGEGGHEQQGPLLRAIQQVLLDLPHQGVEGV